MFQATSQAGCGSDLSFGARRGIINLRGLPDKIARSRMMNDAQRHEEQFAVPDQFSASQVRLILASASPRRHELLTLLGVPFTVVVSHAEEDTTPVPAAIRQALPACTLSLHDHPTQRAWRKAWDVWQQHAADVVLAADTVVVLDTTVLNKPDDAAHAQAMLTRLAGRTHTVYTGLCVYTRHQHEPCFDLVASTVTLAPLSQAEIAAYVATGEPLDKAGGYGIQGLGGRLVQQVAGSHTAVVGLPLPATWQLLTAAGVAALRDPTEAYQTWLRHRQQRQHKESAVWLHIQP